MSENAENQTVENSEAAASGSDEKVIYKFIVHLNPVKYAKRFGVDIPDDSADIGLSGDGDGDGIASDAPKAAQERENDTGSADDAPEAEERAQDGAEGLLEQDAEDATVNYGKRMAGTMAGQCAATLAQCKAKNPMTCRFHGAKVIATDIENFLRQQGVQGQVEVNLQNVSQSGKKTLLSAEVSVAGTKKDEKLVTAAMKNFAALPGVDYVEDGDYDGSTHKVYSGFDIDILNPNAKARWGAGQQPPQPSPRPSPQPKAATSKPKAAPKSQQKANAAQTPSPKPAPQPQQPVAPPAPAPAPTPVATPTANGSKLHPIAPPPPQKTFVPDFTQADLSDLEDCRSTLETAARCLNGRVGNLQALKNSSRFPVLDSLPDDSAFNKRLDDLTKNKNVQVAAAAADLKKIADNIAASKKAGWTLPAGQVDDATTFAAKLPPLQVVPEPPKSEEEKREGIVKIAKAIKSSSGTEAPIAKADDILSAHEKMTEMENLISLLDDEFRNETDPSAQAWLKGVIDDIDMAYGAEKKKFDDAATVVDAWVKSKKPMPEGATIKDVIKGFVDRGEHVPDVLNGLDKHITQKKNDDAWNEIKKFYGFTDADRPMCEKFAKKNMYAFSQKQTILHWSHNCIDNLIANGRVTASSGYDSLFSNNAGHKVKRHATGKMKGFTVGDEGTLFCRAMKGTAGKQQNWWDSSQWAVVLRNDKAVMMVGPGLYGGCSRWTGRANHQLSLASDFQLCNALPSELKKDFFTKDLSGLSADAMHDAMFANKDHGSANNEIFPLGGITWETGQAAKFDSPVPPTLAELPQTSRNELKKHGWKLYYDGNKELVL